MNSEDRVIHLLDELIKVRKELDDTKKKLAEAKRNSNELQAVMISVDKWLDHPSELEENPATRAARARKIALKAIEAAEFHASQMHAIALVQVEDYKHGRGSGPDGLLTALKRIVELGDGDK